MSRSSRNSQSNEPSDGYTTQVILQIKNEFNVNFSEIKRELKEMKETNNALNTMLTNQTSEIQRLNEEVRKLSTTIKEQKKTNELTVSRLNAEIQDLKSCIENQSQRIEQSTLRQILTTPTDSTDNNCNTTDSNTIKQSFADIVKNTVKSALYESEENKVLSNVNINTVQNSLKEIMKQEREEDEEKERKKNNLLVFNIEESVSKNINERIEHDKMIIKELSSKLDMENIEVKSNRIGKHVEGKQRPILLKFNQTDEKIKYLKNAYKLKNIEKENVISRAVIKQDLTKKQLEKEKALVEEMNRKKAKGEDVFIRRGKILKREPVNPK